MTLQPQHITEHFINTYVKPGNVVVDATAGNGNVTLKLCRAVTETGKVFSFDIQESALRETKKKIAAENFSNAELICDSHSNMELYITNKVDCVVFNLGYLPGGDHSLQTKYTTTIEAIEKSLCILKETGFISITIYYGKNSGTEEKEKVLEYLETLNHKLYTVTLHHFFNRPNNPPLTAIITKNSETK